MLKLTQLSIDKKCTEMYIYMKGLAGALRLVHIYQYEVGRLLIKLSFSFGVFANLTQQVGKE